MSVICPCVTAVNAQAYREQMARVAPFASRVHIDFGDGKFDPVKLINPVQAYWPTKVVADLHLMLQEPTQQIETIISLQPNLVIIHAEASGDLVGMLRELRAVAIKVGVALLQKSEPEQYRHLIAEADHVLIFSGDLGNFGGQADLTLLKKVRLIRSINPTAELGWDGGVSLDNAAQLAAAGVDVLNAGGAIQKADDPKAAYRALQEALKNAQVDN